MGSISQMTTKRAAAWFAAVLIAWAVPGVAKAAVFDFDFTSGSVDLGSGTGVGYVAGADFTVDPGRARLLTQVDPAIQMLEVHRGAPGGTIGNQVTANGQYPVARVTGATFGAGIYEVTSTGAVTVVGAGTQTLGLRNAGLVFGYQDNSNFYWAGGRDVSNFAFGGTAAVWKVVNGVATRLTGSINATSPAADDILTTTVDWDPVTGDIHVSWLHTDKTGTIIKLDTGTTVNDTAFSSGQTGLMGFETEFSGRYFYKSFSYVPEPSSLALVGIGGLGLLARRRRTA